MINDNETNFLYLADTLEKKYPDFFARFKQILNGHNVSHGILPGTKDVWAVDYMPIQVDTDHFAQFVYNPQYLHPLKYHKTISDVNAICERIGIKPVKSDILVDGGNVTRFGNTVIMCDRILDENKHLKEDYLLEQLSKELQVERIVIIPTHPLDFTGHSDGLVRFFDEHTVITNNYSKDDNTFRRSLKFALRNAGYSLVEIPYNPYGNGNDMNDCKGEYINYLHMDGLIVLPSFGMKEDGMVFDIFKELFKNDVVTSVESKELAKDGGILNCITWNIKR